MIDTIIPERGTKAFAEYKAGVEWEYEHGAKIEIQERHCGTWRPCIGPNFKCWETHLYRVSPEPHPIDQWRAMTPEQREGKVLETLQSSGKWIRSGYNEDLKSDVFPSDYDHTYQIRALTLAERNAIVRQRWEAMEETERKGVRKDKEGKQWTWTLDGHDVKNWPANLTSEPRWMEEWGYAYRIVEVPEPPKPRYVPFTRETCPVGEVIEHNGMRSLINAASADCAWIGGYPYTWMSFDALLRSGAKRADGSPCGTLATES